MPKGEGGCIFLFSWTNLLNMGRAQIGPLNSPLSFVLQMNSQGTSISHPPMLFFAVPMARLWSILLCCGQVGRQSQTGQVDAWHQQWGIFQRWCGVLHCVYRPQYSVCDLQFHCWQFVVAKLRCLEIRWLFPAFLINGSANFFWKCF